MPKISVCIPTYNRSNYLAYAVHSVLNQTYGDFELIICDDGSTDNTPAMVQQWQDSRIQYLRHPLNIGRSRNMRSGFDRAIGEYFIKFDDDDAITPQFLEKTVHILETQPTIDFVCTDHWVINSQGVRDIQATEENSQKWGKTRLPLGIISNLLEETFIHQSLQVGSTLFRRQCLQDVDYMKPSADGCEDFDLLVRLAIKEYTGYFIPERLMEYRFHGGQTSLKQNIHFLKAKLSCLQSYHFSDPNLQQSLQQKLSATQQSLGLRLIEQGDTKEGRSLVKTSLISMGYSSKVIIGLILSYLPLSLRKTAFDLFRKNRPQDYSEKVRNQTLIS